MLAKLVVAAAVAVASVSAQTYVGCNDLLGLGISFPTFPKATEADCIQTCRNSNWAWAYYQTSTTLCFCSTDSTQSRALTPASKASCTNNFRQYALSTTFQDVTCAAGLTRDSRDASAPTSSVTYLNQCYQNCRNYKYAIFQQAVSLLVVFTYTCQCANYPPIISGSTACTSNSFYLQQHSAGAQASGLARREAKARAVQAQIEFDANPYCPVGFKPCQVSPIPSDGYECLRTESELESCGGCLWGLYGQDNGNANATGVDCTSLEGVEASGVTCKLGECRIARCRRGYRLHNGACEARN